MTPEQFLQFLTMTLAGCIGLGIWLHVFGKLMDKPTFSQVAKILFCSAYAILLTMIACAIGVFTH